MLGRLCRLFCEDDEEGEGMFCQTRCGNTTKKVVGEHVLVIVLIYYRSGNENYYLPGSFQGASRACLAHNVAQNIAQRGL